MKKNRRWMIEQYDGMLYWERNICSNWWRINITTFSKHTKLENSVISGIFILYFKILFLMYYFEFLIYKTFVNWIIFFLTFCSSAPAAIPSSAPVCNGDYMIIYALIPNIKFSKKFYIYNITWSKNCKFKLNQMNESLKVFSCMGTTKIYTQIKIQYANGWWAWPPLQKYNLLLG